MGKKSKRKATKLARKYGAAQLAQMGLTPKPKKTSDVTTDVDDLTTGDRNALFLASNMPEEDARNYLGAVAPHLLVGPDTMFEEVETGSVLYKGELLTEEKVEEIAGFSGQRFEARDFETYYAIIDRFTGFIALEDSLDDATADAATLNETPQAAGQLDWQLARADAEVCSPSGGMGERFYLLWASGRGYAIYDIAADKVHPIPEHIDDAAMEALGMWNDATPEERSALFEECELQQKQDGESVHWIEPGEWSAPEPEDIPESIGADESPQRVRVLVVSSAAWSHSSIVPHLIQSYWDGMGNPPMTICTSGSPHGAEGVAQRLAESGNGIEWAQVLDYSIAYSDIDYAFAFITNNSPDATRALHVLESLRIPTHVMTETSADFRDPWAGR